MSTNILEQLTYNLGRMCAYCGAPIADQVHLLRKFCPNIVLPNGRTISHKDLYNSPKTRLKNAPFKAIAAFYEDQFERITELVKAKGDLVSAEDLDQWKINLGRSFEHEMTKYGIAYYYYHKFAIKMMAKNLFKISEHDKF